MTLKSVLDACDPFVDWYSCWTGYFNFKRVGRIVPYRRPEITHPRYYLDANHPTTMLGVNNGTRT